MAILLDYGLRVDKVEFKQSPITTLLNILSKKWTVEILEDLFEEELQFSELETRHAQMSGKMLSRRVKELFELGLIGKVIAKISPLEFKYRITDRGRSLKAIFYYLSVIGTKLFRETVLDEPAVDTIEIEQYFKARYLD